MSTYTRTVQRPQLPARNRTTEVVKGVTHEYGVVPAIGPIPPIYVAPSLP